MQSFYKSFYKICHLWRWLQLPVMMFLLVFEPNKDFNQNLPQLICLLLGLGPEVYCSMKSFCLVSMFGIKSHGIVCRGKDVLGKSSPFTVKPFCFFFSLSSVWGLLQSVFTSGEFKNPPEEPHGREAVHLSAPRLPQGFQQLQRPSQAPENASGHGERHKNPLRVHFTVSTNLSHLDLQGTHCLWRNSVELVLMMSLCHKCPKPLWFKLSYKL